MELILNQCIKSQKHLCGSISCEICFERSLASLPEKLVNYVMLEAKPITTFKKSTKSFLFLCKICGHEFRSSAKRFIYMKTACQYCDDSALCFRKSCFVCFNKSFASYDLAKVSCWDDSNGCSPRETFRDCASKFLFKCNVCNHKFDASPKQVIEKYWCPYCEGRKLCDSGCYTCYNKSFASEDPDKVILWSMDNVKTPRQISKESRSKYVFNCDKCPHKFNAYLNNISCPYCREYPIKFCAGPLCTDHYNKKTSLEPVASLYYPTENRIEYFF